MSSESADFAKLANLLDEAAKEIESLEEISMYCPYNTGLEFGAHIRAIGERVRKKDHSALKALIPIFAPTCCWDDTFGEAGMHQASLICGILDRLRWWDDRPDDVRRRAEAIRHRAAVLAVIFLIVVPAMLAAVVPFVAAMSPIPDADAAGWHARLNTCVACIVAVAACAGLACIGLAFRYRYRPRQPRHAEPGVGADSR